MKHMLKNYSIKAVLFLAILLCYGSKNIIAQDFNYPVLWKTCKGENKYDTLNGTCIFSYDGKFLYTVTDIDLSKILRLNSITGNVVNVFSKKQFKGYLWNPTNYYTPDNKYLIAKTEYNGFARISLDEQNEVKVFMDSMTIRSTALDTVNKRMYICIHKGAEGDNKQDIWQYDYESDKSPYKIIENIESKAICYDYKNQHIISIGLTNDDHYEPHIAWNALEIFDLTNMKLLKKVELLKYNERADINDIRLSPSCNYLIGENCIFDLNNFTIIKKFLFYDFSFYKSDSVIVYTNLDNQNNTSETFFYNPFLEKVISTIKLDRYARIVSWPDNKSFLFMSTSTKNSEPACAYLLNAENLLTGIATNPNETIEIIYPNPSNGLVQISLSNSELTHVQATISNPNGINVLTFPNLLIYNNQIRFDISNLNSGIYFLKLQAPNYNKTFKIIKGA